jgi:hypothetical protein
VYRVLCDGRDMFRGLASSHGEGSHRARLAERRFEKSMHGAHVSDIERALVGRFSGAQVRAALATLEDENYVRSPVKEYYRPVKIRQM